MSINQNDVFISGRGRASAKAALAAVAEAGLEASTVRTVSGGYLIPLAAEGFYVAPGAEVETPAADPEVKVDETKTEEKPEEAKTEVKAEETKAETKVEEKPAPKAAPAAKAK